MAVQLLKTNIEDKFKAFALMKSQDVIGLKEVPNGTELEFNGYVLTHIIKDNPKENDTDIEFDSITFMSVDNGHYATRSQNVIQLINDIEATFGNEVISNGLTFIKSTGRSNNGRDFVTLSLKV